MIKGIPNGFSVLDTVILPQGWCGISRNGEKGVAKVEFSFAISKTQATSLVQDNAILHTKNHLAINI